MARTSKTPPKPSLKLSAKAGKSTKAHASKSASPKTTPNQETQEFKDVRSLIELMKKNGLAVFKFEQGDFKITLKTPEGAAGGTTVLHGAPPSPGAVAPQAVKATSDITTPSEPEKSNYLEIKSPMVGTFYTTPSPDAPPFVEVGKTINAETVVCIIEAMKVMNEIKAEIAGKVVEIVAENGKPVQFGEVLFRVS
ncbi:MAG: acetyl-CoA carboxylase biotin carboxyl carrier protein [bacterium]